MPMAVKKYQNTTVRVPTRVYEQAKVAIGRSQGASFNEFVVQAIEEKVRRLSEAEIDAAFDGMAQDPQYQRDAVAMAQEFEKSDWEALETATRQPTIFAPVVDLMKTFKKSNSQKAPPHGRASKARSR